MASRRYEERADGNPTGRYGLEVIYRLPDDARAAGVLDHYRRQIPPRWSEASDATCPGVLSSQAGPPSSAPGDITAPGPDPDAFRAARDFDTP